jgi:4-carboxymuconolactone decarboxylase
MERGPGQVDTHAAGLQARREVLGEEHVERSLAGASPLREKWLEHTHRHAWGSTWPRPGLDRKTRSAVTLAMLISLRLEHEIALHARAAIGNGMTPDELLELAVHASVYVGFPAAHVAFATIESTLREMGAIE